MESLQISRAYRYCEWVTSHHYENFPVASWLLPRELRPHVAAIYAFARSADDFADEGKYQGRSLELLDDWRRRLAVIARSNGDEAISFQNEIASAPQPALSKAEGGPRNDGCPSSSHPIFIALADTVRRRELPVQLLDDLLTAFRMDVTKRRYADWEELMTYCRHSANPVGRLVLILFEIRDQEMHAWSDRICTGLQLANHWQDLKLDLARDILYIPQTLLRHHGMTEPDLRKGERVASSPAFQALMKDLVQRTRALFDEGEPLIRRVSGGLRLELKLTLLGGRAILDRIEAARYDVFRHRPVLSGWDKLRLLTRALKTGTAQKGTPHRVGYPRLGSPRTLAPALAGAFDYCRWVTARARSHFSLSFSLLPLEQRRAMEALYAYCRAIDDVADRAEAPDLFFQTEELKRWRRELQACASGCPAHPVAVALEWVQERYDIPREYFEKLIAGVEMDVSRRRYGTFEELKVYCEHVASVVGLISVRIFGCVHPEADRYATTLGIAFQLTNILRDVRADAQGGRVYLPLEEMRRYGCSERDLTAGRMTPELKRFLSFQCVRARAFFLEAREARLNIGWEKEKLFPARIMEAVYGRLLERVEKAGENSFVRRVSIPRGEQMAIALRCLAGF